MPCSSTQACPAPFPCLDRALLRLALLCPALLPRLALALQAFHAPCPCPGRPCFALSSSALPSSGLSHALIGPASSCHHLLCPLEPCPYPGRSFPALLPRPALPHVLALTGPASPCPALPCPIPALSPDLLCLALPMDLPSSPWSGLCWSASCHHRSARPHPGRWSVAMVC